MRTDRRAVVHKTLPWMSLAMGNRIGGPGPTPAAALPLNVQPVQPAMGPCPAWDPGRVSGVTDICWTCLRPERFDRQMPQHPVQGGPCAAAGRNETNRDPQPIT